MIPQKSLVLYKNKLAMVSSHAESRLGIEIEGDEPRKVRDKDVSLVHPGPVNAIPQSPDSGDFETAYEMLSAGQNEGESAPTTWKELCELVFGEYTPAAAAACVRFSLQGELFKIIDGNPCPIGKTELEISRRKNEEKRLESVRRSEFIADMKKAIRDKEKKFDFRIQQYARFVSELESFALDQAEKCPLAQDIGLSATRESVHKALIDSGIWNAWFNPWPARAGCPLSSPKSVFPELPHFDENDRLDLCALDAFAIDNSWSHDPDDAISVDGEWLWVHIADPAAYLTPDSPADIEALARGATLYLPEKTVPMLPNEAVERLGLGLKEKSPALSFGMRLSANGAIEEYRIAPSLVRVTRRSYEAADALIAEGHATLTRLEKFAIIRHERRLENGAVDIDFPEVSIKAREGLVSFLPVPATRSSAMVREMMLLAGEAAARWALERKLPFTYSSQEAPTLPKDVALTESGALSLAAQFARRKGMRAGIVGPESLAHKGLGLSFYSQVTSPLRRYQDLLAHYQIRAWLARQSDPAAAARFEILSEDEISRRCVIAGQAAAATRQAERDSRAHWIACHLAGHPDWTGEAIVLESREREITAFVPEFGYETVVRVRAGLAPDERITLRLARASIALRDITFELI